MNTPRRVSSTLGSTQKGVTYWDNERNTEYTVSVDMDTQCFGRHHADDIERFVLKKNLTQKPL